MFSTEIAGIDNQQLERRVLQELAEADSSKRRPHRRTTGAELSASTEQAEPAPPTAAIREEAASPAPQEQVGWFRRSVRAVAALFGRTGRLQSEVSAIWAWAEASARHVHEAEKQIERLQRELLAVRVELSTLRAATDAAREHLGATRSDLSRTQQVVSRLQADLHFEHRRLARIAAGQPPAMAGAVSMPGEDIGSRFALSFEERFRGARSDIKERLRFYLAHVKEQPTLTARQPLLDVGCGRGEWLELLREAGITAYGLDTNAYVVEACRNIGLHVLQADVLGHLGKLPDNALGGISIFHVIEHLPLDPLLQLVDECRRTLVPGGLLLIETPNPENLKVGACTFHNDPTHLRPIPPQLAEYLVASRGFTEVEVQRINPYPASSLIAEQSETAKRLNDLLYGPQDVAVIARKA